MEVTFGKLVEQKVTTWDAVRGKRSRVPGSTMALGRGGLPHDLVQFVVEATLGLDRGFWGSVADGATFRRTGRKRTRPGRAVIARNRHELDAAEHIVNEHYRRWMCGEPTPAAPALAAMRARWDALGDGGQLTVEWPRFAARRGRPQHGTTSS
ncbi:MAG: hypothetical protein ACRD12_05925 [Acidimicrobiales bacterium]